MDKVLFKKHLCIPSQQFSETTLEQNKVR